MSATLAVNILDPHSLLSSWGAIGIGVVLFAETGLLIGFFLPGDSLLFTAGLLSATGAGGLRLILPWGLRGAAAGALLGAQVGFVIGRRAGTAMESRANHPRLAAGMRRAEDLFTRYGPAKAHVVDQCAPAAV